ncbi:MAG: oligosaccharide flippase family protein [Sulfurovum sp.]|nr:oligosaccharide flippase family protein [Sulfurovum sp.]
MLKKILNHSFWLLIGNSIGRLAMFLANIFAARMLPQEVFGQFTMIRSTILMFEGLTSGVLSSTSTKKIAEADHIDKNELPLIISTLFIVDIIIASILMSLIVLNAKFIVATFFIDSVNLVTALYFGAFLLLATSLSSLTQSILIGFEAYKKLAVISIMVSIGMIPVIFSLIYIFGLYGALFGIASYYLCDFIFKVYHLKSITKELQYTFSMSDIWNKIKVVMSFSLPLFVTITMSSIAFWYVRVLLVNQTNEFESIAIFDASFQWLTIIMIITGATTNVALPILSKAIGSQSRSVVKNILGLNMLINMMIAVIIASIFIIFSKNIMSIYGKNYIEGYNILIILALTSIVFTTSSMFNKYMIAHNNLSVILVNTIFSIIILFIVFVIGFNYSVKGLAWSFFAFYSFSTFFYLLVYLLLNREQKENINE